MGRKLNNTFMKDLEKGRLQSLLTVVQKDDTLDLQIRHDCVHIYYRGGRLFEIREVDKGAYKISSSDEAYNKEIKKEDLSYPRTVRTKQDAVAVSADVSKLKIVMDRYLSRKKDKTEKKKSGKEREYQQLIVKENNYTRNITNGTDYYACDIEYEEGENRWDILAIKWESDGAKRKNTKDLELAIIEVKYGDNALDGDSGLIDHLRKTNNLLLKESSRIKELAAEMTESFNQKLKLNLIVDCKHEKIGPLAVTEKLDFIFVLINHDPARRALRNALDEIKRENFEKLNIKFAISNFMGYGLYIENIYDLEEFEAAFSKQIYSKSKEE